MQTPTDQLSATFSALADPTRRAILARLAKGEATVNELAAPFDISLPAISKHLKVLQRAGLIEQGRQAQWRPCRLKPEPLRDVASVDGDDIGGGAPGVSRANLTEDAGEKETRAGHEGRIRVPQPGVGRRCS